MVVEKREKIKKQRKRKICLESKSLITEVNNPFNSLTINCTKPLNEALTFFVMTVQTLTTGIQEREKNSIQ